MNNAIPAVLRRDGIRAMVDHVLRDEGSGHIVIGPVLWRLDEANKKLWYIIAASAGGSGFRTDLLGFGADQDLADECRMSIIAGIATCGKPIVVHECDNELYMARLCATIWPCEKTRQIRAGIEAERRKKRG